MKVKQESAPPAEADPGSDARCRCCYAQLSGDCKRLTEKYSLGEVCEVFSELLTETFIISLSTSDDDCICEPCVGRLRDANAFRRIVLETDRLFRRSRPGTSQPDTSQPSTMELEVKLEVVEESELGEAEEATWDNDYLETDYYTERPTSPKLESAKVKREKPAGVFTPVARSVEDLLKQKSAKRQSLLSGFTKLLAGRATAKPLKKSFITNTLRALAGKPLSTKRSGGAAKPAVTLAKARVLSVAKSNTLASKLLRPEARAGAGEGRAKLNVDSILKALNFRPRARVKAEPDPHAEARTAATMRGAQTELFNVDALDKRTERQIVKQNVILLLRHTTVCPFISFRSNFRCLYCGESYFNFDDLRAHTGEAHSDINKAVRKVHSFKDIIHVDITSLRCRRCKQDCPDIQTMKEHLVKEHKVRINMKHKDDVIPFKLSGTESKCHLCPEEFHVFRNLSLHMNVHFPNYMCEVCGKAFVSAKRCSSHEDTHRKGSFPCTKCPRVFESMNARSAHTFEHRETKYRCPQCPARFEKYLQRTVHMSEVHDVTRNFRCPQPDCDRQFIHKPQMAAHMRTHSVKEKKVACGECGMRFHNNYALRKHMVSHTGERPFQCKVCGKKYGRKNTLREHMRIHENDRRHVCSQCGQGFVQKCSLNGHMKSRHPHAVAF